MILQGLNDIGYTILIFASCYNHIKIIKLLLSYDNININKQQGVSDIILFYYNLYYNII